MECCVLGFANASAMSGFFLPGFQTLEFACDAVILWVRQMTIRQLADWVSPSPPGRVHQSIEEGLVK